MTLALKFRPQVWSDLVGQATTVRILRALIMRGQQVPLIILSGPRGTGKTTSARILAKAVNCVNRPSGTADPCNTCSICTAIQDERCPDVVELDAASNGGVDAIRRLRELSLYRPIMATNRVIIIDEAHAMSGSAFQALLKILEEPPANTIFVMATTEVSAIPDTIVSRSFPFEYRRITAHEIAARLQYIAAIENISATSSAIQYLSEQVSGGMRDAVTLMEQVSLLGETITEELIQKVLGRLTRQEILRLFEFILAGQRVKVLIWTAQQRDRGTEPVAMMSSLVTYVRDMIAVSLGFRGDLSETDFDLVFRQSQGFRKESLVGVLNRLLELAARFERIHVPPYVQIESALLGVVDDCSRSDVRSNTANSDDKR